MSPDGRDVPNLNGTDLMGRLKEKLAAPLNQGGPCQLGEGDSTAYEYPFLIFVQPAHGRDPGDVDQSPSLKPSKSEQRNQVSATRENPPLAISQGTQGFFFAFCTYVIEATHRFILEFSALPPSLPR
jgi:hypothetical protein